MRKWDGVSTKEEYRETQDKASTGRNTAAEISSRQSLFERQAREFNASLEPVRWLTTGEAAQYLRVSISSLKTMIYRGQARAHKLGRRNRFLKEELDRLITPPSTN